MATFSDGSYFLVLHSILWLIFNLFCQETVGDTVHVMAVTPAPFGAALLGTSFSCLLSNPDTDQLDTLKNNLRYILRGTMHPLNTLQLPVGTSYSPIPSLNAQIAILPVNHEAQGMFVCEASKGALTTRVPVTILAHDRRFQPSAGQFTVTANVGDESVDLAVDIVSIPDGISEKKIIWQKQGQRTQDFETYESSNSNMFSISPVSVEDAGVYATYWRGQRKDFRFSLIRLIVRACVHGRWGPPSCTGICDNCYNGGICDDKTGECVCRPGFTGPNCLTEFNKPPGFTGAVLQFVAKTKFGWYCEHGCGTGLAVSSCEGSVFCMPDPVGCSCMTGYMGTECNQGCSPGKFGAGCTEDCNCAAGTCDKFTGECTGKCHEKWTGPSCQIPVSCEAGYYGTNCTDKCNCQCDKVTGSCVQAVECLRGFHGPNCESECHCNYCSRTTGCMNRQCYDGFYGANCENECHCDNCDRTTGCMNSQCHDGFYGSNCENECHCDNCDQLTGCQNSPQCYDGFYGSNCESECHCNNCDRTTGCLHKQYCFDGFWGPKCEMECHCLNAAACNRNSSKCDADTTIGLSLCETGYGSDTGVNLDNCQQYEGCFAYCTKTCHCVSSNTCNLGAGNCGSQGCKPNWSGASCQTGIVSFIYDKTNPGQPVIVTCIVTGDPDIPTADQVSLEYFASESDLLPTGNQTRNENLGIYLMVTFEAKPPGGVKLNCAVRFTDEGITHASYATVMMDYYDLPVLSQSPYAENLNNTSVKILWNTWDSSAGDTGDGPVIAYNLYVNSLLTVENIDGQTPSNMLSEVVGSLTPSTTYQFYVTAIREGTGGEGPPSPNVTVTTLPITTQPPPTTIKTMTTSEPTTAEIPVISPELTTPKISTKPERTSISGATSSSGTSDSGTAEETPMSKPSSQQESIIVAVILTLVFVLVFIIALIWFLRWRRRQQPKRYPPSLVASEADLDRLSSVFPDSSSVLEAHPVSNFGSIDNLGFDESDEKPENKPRPQSQPLPVSPDSTPALRRRPQSTGVSTASITKKMTIQAVNVKDYAKYMKTKRQGTDLVVEWESLPKNLARPTTIAKKSENKGKNRYRNVVAYDHSRVVLEPLEDDPNSDYVNACYIKGIKNPKAYIASQGPNDVTVGDFWRMVWQENISVMVMACNVIEEGKLKCTKYWPEKDAPVVTNGITIVWNSEEQKEEYCIIRKFTINKEGEAARELLHFHYTSWPDKDVPKHCTPVLKFIKDVNENHDRKAPLLIHCSAGAGRTGTIIAIHGMMELAEEKNQVDIYNFVFSMRNSRPNMVQTDDQYIFVHDAILEYLFCKNTFIEVSMFASRLKSLREQNPETGRTFLEEEYEIVNLTSPNFGPEKIRGSTNPDGVAKIRSGDSIPVDSSRPYLMTPRGDDDRSPYINAAYMDGYKKKDLFISTQMPMAHTVVDLWRMMYDYNCTSIVMLNAMDPEDEDCPQFWPDAGTSDFGPFTVTLLEHESTEDIEIRTLQLVYTKRDVKSPIPVRHFQYMTWPKDDETPAMPHGILQLISSVEKWQKTLPEPGSIVVLCMNAAGRSGAFCTIQTALDQVREEQGVDILQRVKQLRIHRTNVVDTPTKYLFCYEAILEYLKAFDDYSGKKPYQNVPDFNKQKEEENKEMNNLYGNIPSTGVLNSDTTAIAGGKSAPSGRSTDIKPSAKEKPKPSAESGTPKSNRRGGKKPPQKSTKSNQEQLYQNVMFDTEL